MIKGNLTRYIILAMILVVLQVPLLHNWVVYGVAFPFPYIGFILLLPHTLPRSSLMIIGFFLGLIVDIFSNTPGMHASITVLIAYMRSAWMKVVVDVSHEEMDVSLTYFGIVNMLFYGLPLVLLHHLVLFVLENEGFRPLVMILTKGFWSSILSFSIILLSLLVVRDSKRRV